MQKIISYLIYKTITAIAFLFSLFPRKLNLFLGKNLGVIVYFIGIRKKVAKINESYKANSRKDIYFDYFLFDREFTFNIGMAKDKKTKLFAAFSVEK